MGLDLGAPKVVSQSSSGKAHFFKRGKEKEVLLLSLQGEKLDVLLFESKAQKESEKHVCDPFQFCALKCLSLLLVVSLPAAGLA